MDILIRDPLIGTSNTDKSIGLKFLRKQIIWYTVVNYL